MIFAAVIVLLVLNAVVMVAFQYHSNGMKALRRINRDQERRRTPREWQRTFWSHGDGPFQ
jgi:hypothetical protein